MIKSRRGWSAAKAEERWLKVFRTLHEFQARLFAADKALDLGRGRCRLARWTGLSRDDHHQRGGGIAGGPETGGPRRGAGPGSRRRAKEDGGDRPRRAGVVAEDLGGNHGRGSDELVALDLQVHTDPGRGVDSFRSPGHVGDGRSLPRSHGVLLTGQPQDPGRPATRPWGRAIPLPPWAGEGGVARGRPGDCGGRQEEGVGGTL